MGACSDSSDVRSLEAFGALRKIELDSLAFVQRPVSILLDGGIVDENILAGRALDESVTFSSVEPLHRTLLSTHKQTPPKSVISLAVATRGLDSAKARG
jgi:hypothetical protein